MSDPTNDLISSIDTTGLGNQAGQDQICFRASTYPEFLRKMTASLSTTAVPVDPTSVAANTTGDALTGRPLIDLTTRQSSDPTIALLDAWACAGDVLTFYNERIANEVYLRTALQPRSMAEMSRLVGYTPRPGVAASVYLSFNVNDGAALTIAAGTPVQSVPAPDDVSQIPQTFETSDDLDASSDLNEFKPQMTQPLTSTDLPVAPPPESNAEIKSITVAGITNNLHEGDIIFADGGDSYRKAFRITSVELLKANDAFKSRTVIGLMSLEFTSPANATVKAEEEDLQKMQIRSSDSWRVRLQKGLDRVGYEINKKVRKPIIPPNSRPVPLRGLLLPTTGSTLPKPSLDSAIESVQSDSIGVVPPAGDIKSAFMSVGQPGAPAPEGNPGKPNNNAVATVTSISEPQIQLLEELSGGAPGEALQSVRATVYLGAPSDVPSLATPILYVFRQQAAPFGKDAPLVATAITGKPVTFSDWGPDQFEAAIGSDTQRLILNKSYPAILPGSWVMIVTPSQSKDAQPPAPVPVFAQVKGVAERTATGLGTAVSATELQLSDPWHPDPFDYMDVRQTTVWVCSEALDTSAGPINNDALKFTTDSGNAKAAVQSTLEIKLDALHRGLKIGKPLILTGELVKVPGTAVCDVFTVTSAKHFVSAASPYTSVTVQRSVAPVPPGSKADSNAPDRSYKLSTVRLFGNIVSATHGETQNEVLGSGDASVPLQTFTLKAKPLTYVSAPNQLGLQSTLNVYVNDVRWHEATAGLSDAWPNDNVYTIRIDKTDNGSSKTSIIFGNGKKGASPPTGRENIRAVYRTGIGTVGNVPAGRITLLKRRPQGLKGVNNPLAASAGADPEAADSIRVNASVGLRSLGRLVSCEDYQDFARAFAGVTKAKASKPGATGRPLISIVVAGDGPEPLDPNSDVIKNLKLAMQNYGIPSVDVTVDQHRKLLILLQVSVTMYPDFTWSVVQDAIGDALFYNFGYAGQNLGESVYQSEVAKVIQLVPGVEYVTIDAFTSISGDLPASLDDLTSLVTNALHDAKQPVHSISAGADQIAYLTPDVEMMLVISQAGSTPFTAVSGGVS